MYVSYLLLRTMNDERLLTTYYSMVQYTLTIIMLNAIQIQNKATRIMCVLRTRHCKTYCQNYK